MDIYLTREQNSFYSMNLQIRFQPFGWEMMGVWGSLCLVAWGLMS